MRLLLTLVATGTFACRCQPMLSATGEESLIVTPTTLEFAPTWVGQRATRQLTVLNPNRTAVTVALSSDAPFAASPQTFQLSGGEAREVQLVFEPTRAGSFTSGLAADSVQRREATIELRGVAHAVPDCPATGACTRPHFDLDAGVCGSLVLPDDTDCVAADACFAEAVCQRGECVGRRHTCDDRDRCTTDACGESGCVHLDGVLDCPPSPNPCLSQACDATTGCGFEVVPDGTSCGTRDCSMAQVCIAGQCQLRAVPQGQACVEVVAGSPGSCGVVDGVGASARVGYQALALAASGDVFIAETNANLVRRVTTAGVVTTIAGQPSAGPGYVDAFGSAARFEFPRAIAVNSKGVIFVGERARIRQLNAQGLVRTFAGSVTSGHRDGPVHQALFEDVVDLAVGPHDELYVVAGRHVRVIARGVVRTLSLPPSISAVTSVSVAPNGRVSLASRSTVWSLEGDGGVALVTASLSDVRDIAVTQDEVLITDQSGVNAGIWRVSGRAVLPISSDNALAVASNGREAAFLRFARSPRGPTQCALYAWTLDGGSRFIAGAPRTAPVLGWLNFPTELATGSHDDEVLVVDEGSQRVMALTSGALQALGAFPAGRDTLEAAISTPRGVVAAISTTSSSQVVPVDGGLPLFSVNDYIMGLSWSDAGLAVLTRSEILFWDGGANLSANTAGTARDIAFAQSAAAFYTLDDSVLRRVDATGPTDIAGTPMMRGNSDGQGANARFRVPRGLDVTAQGEVFVADTGNLAVRRVSTTGLVTTVATLADAPQDVLVEDGGSLLVTVPGGVVRVRP